MLILLRFFLLCFFLFSSIDLCFCESIDELSTDKVIMEEEDTRNFIQRNAWPIYFTFAFIAVICFGSAFYVYPAFIFDEDGNFSP